MAGNSFHRFWSWIPIVILSSHFILSNTDDQAPCVSYTSNVTEDVYEQPQTEVTVFLREDCSSETNVTDIQEFFDRSNFDVRIAVIPTSLSCERKTRGLDTLLRILGERKTKVVVAAVDTPMCEVTARLARLWNVSLFTWTCPLKDDTDTREFSSIVRLSPSLPAIAKALTEILMNLKWKAVSMIGTDREPWSSLDRALLNALRGIGAILRYHVILPYHASLEEIRKLLRPTHNISRRVTLLCLPTSDDNDITSRVLAELDGARKSSRTVGTSTTVIVHTQDDDSFLPEAKTRTYTSVSRFVTTVSISPENFTSSNISSFNESRDYHSPGLHDAYETKQTSDEEREEEEEETLEETEGLGTEIETEAEEKERKRRYRYFPPRNLSSDFLEKLLIITPLDHRYDAEKVYDGTETYARPSLFDRLNETFTVLMHDNSTINSFNNKMYAYVLLDWRLDVDAWKPIMISIEQRKKLLVRKLSANAPVFLGANIDILKCNAEVDVEFGIDCTENSADETAFRIARIVTVVLGSLLLTTFAILTGILIRRKLLKKRISKGQYKIILTTSDFVFPQVPRVDFRRVDEGIETMLSCWLQQLQEFGGPDVEKPDLLQLGSVSSLRPYLRTSTGNLARHGFFKVPRAQYNGDLVQLKELPAEDGTFELKSKAMDVLVVMHGLRHENLNPLIGCLNEPTRPCLVYEYCSRGSLEDVLVQDEIKLDWSFRLSLLTDLVRGMRYLHGTPVRVHGYLTSRNCVIDARWVLKVTDYGLPAFYEAQNIECPAKTARDLLWTAPELLRHPNLRKKGTQPGDVYSFGIIMQEVVVRGEPYCMLALSPEDIMEKLKKPPPLIRPSVSKGAAPPEAINIMRQCWAETADMRPDFNDVHDRFKTLNHGRKVNFVDTMFQMLEKYSNNLEELIRERTEQLDMEKKKTEQLLNRMLPSSVAEKLKLGMPVDPEEFREVTIYFSDIVGFTSISAHSTPFQVVDLLNDLYTCFDATINAYTVYKVETIGDAYMVVGGCPVRIPDHASQIATMALDLLHQSGKFKLRHLPKTQLKLRIGLHTGPCCAGVVGLTMPRYCLFGDTVNTASRMESTGAPWRIHLSQETKDRLSQVGGYDIEYRGPTEVKGKGKMPTYWLLGKQGFDKELPTPPSLGFLMLLSVAILPPPSGKTMEIFTRFDSPTHSRLNENTIPEHVTEEKQEMEIVTTTTTMTTAMATTVITIAATTASATMTTTTSEVAPSIDKFSCRNFSLAEDAKDRKAEDNRVADGNVDVAKMTATQSRDEDNVGSGITVSINNEQINGGKSSPQPTDFTNILSPRQTIGDRENDRTDVAGVTKNISAEGRTSLGASTVYSGETAFLGASTSSLTSLPSSAASSYRPGPVRHRRIAGYIDENDLSTPYNHYRCLSPNEHYGRTAGSRFLKRQFSLDRPDDTICIAFAEQSNQQLQLQLQQQQLQQQNLKAGPRLYKQNSAGAANDLERIEEVPSTPTPLLQHYRQSASVSLSVESLTLR